MLDTPQAMAADGLEVECLDLNVAILVSNLGFANFCHHRDAICFFMLGLTISPKIHFGTPKNLDPPPPGGVPC